MAMEGIFVSGTSELLKKLVCVVDDLLANGGTDHQLKMLKKILENIEAVSCDAERKQVNDPDVNRWLIKLKELAYDADDDLDRLSFMCAFKSNTGLPISLNSDIIHEADRLSSEMVKFGLQQNISISNTPSQGPLNQKIPASEYEEFMKLSYGNLPSHLKQCFSYFYLFPEDWKFDRDTLIQMWIAEGFLDQTSNRGNQNSLEDIGNEYLNNLMSCLLFQKVENEDIGNEDIGNLLRGVVKNELGDIIAFKLHHYAHNFARSVAGHHEVRVLTSSEMKKSNASEIRRLRIVLYPPRSDEEEEQDISTVLLRDRKLRTIFWEGGSFWRLTTDCLHLRVMHLVGARSQLSIFSAKHLRYLHLTDCEIVEIDINNGKFHLLQTLNLSKCRNVRMILKEIESMEMLRHLTLSGSDVKVLPESIFTKLLNLQTLDISRCDINVFPVSVGSLQNLLYLDISHTPITGLPDSITSISSLRRLEFHHCHNLKSLPTLGALTQLRSLDLEGSGITELPDSISCIYSLQRLNFKFCKDLKALPRNLGALTRLESLDLEGTGITALPESMSNLIRKFKSVDNITRLEVIMPVLGNSEFSGIRDLAGLVSLRELEITCLENVRGIADAKRALLRYKGHLKELSLKWEGDQEADDDNNSVMVLEGLQPHPNLENLVIENFGGAKLPQWMASSPLCCLPNLVQLYLSDCNRCEKLPGLGMLPNLRVLWISGMRSIKCLGREFYYQEYEEEEEWFYDDDEVEIFTKATTITILFPSLTKLEVGAMDNLQEWGAPPPTYISFPVLETVTIIGCFELTSIPDFQLCTSLPEVIIEECDKLESTLDNFIQREELRDDSSEEYQSQTSIASDRYLVKEITSGTAAHSEIQDIAALETEKFLHIRNLENVRGGKEGAEKATLKDKRNIEDLHLSWNSYSSSNDHDYIDRSVDDAMVLDGLQPHPNLKMLTISGFRGLKLPKWMGSCHWLPNLVNLYFENCNTCEQLPALGMLPCLRILQIEGMNSVRSLDQGFYYLQQGSSNNGEINEEETDTGISVFPSLDELSLTDMSILEDWAAPHHSFNSFPSLKKLIISGCLRLKSIPFGSCSSVQSLELCNTNDEAVNSILASKGGERLTSLPSVSIQYSPQLQFFPVLLLPNHTRIQSLEIAHCSNFQGFRILDNDEFQAQVTPGTGLSTSISSLCSLKLFDCPALTSVPDFREWNSLTSLWFEDCDKLKDYFPYDFASGPSLQTLYVDRFIDLICVRNKEEQTSIEAMKVHQIPNPLFIGGTLYKDYGYGVYPSLTGQIKGAMSNKVSGQIKGAMSNKVSKEEESSNPCKSM